MVCVVVCVCVFACAVNVCVLCIVFDALCDNVLYVFVLCVCLWVLLTVFLFYVMCLCALSVIVCVMFYDYCVVV